TNPQGLTWTYTYDPTGRTLSETDFDGRTLTYTYDAAGQLVTRTDPLGRTVSLERDVCGRIVRKDADGQATTFTYDPAGRLTEAVGPEVALTYRRDRMGRAVAEIVGDRVLTRTYDALGRTVRRTTPSGAKSTFVYDAAGRRTTLTTCGQTLDFAYDARGRETARRFGDTSLAQIWDPAGRLSEQTLTGPETGTLQHRAYTYRPDGHLTGIDDQLHGPRAFDLDEAGRVTAVRAENWTETYAYDEAGNQTHATWPDRHPGADTTGPRAYTGTRITRAGRVRYEHDAAGRLTLRQKTRLSKRPDTWRYTWDAENHLTTVTTPDGNTWRYLYDPLGRRTAKHAEATACRCPKLTATSRAQVRHGSRAVRVSAGPRPAPCSTRGSRRAWCRVRRCTARSTGTASARRPGRSRRLPVALQGDQHLVEAGVGVRSSAVAVRAQVTQAAGPGGRGAQHGDGLAGGLVAAVAVLGHRRAPSRGPSASRAAVRSALWRAAGSVR
ncbi:hypothetical protein ACI2L4_39660, partial [Streptomyces sparsogenes]